MSVYLVGYAKSMSYSEQPTVFWLGDNAFGLNIMLLTNFEKI